MHKPSLPHVDFLSCLLGHMLTSWVPSLPYVDFLSYLLGLLLTSWVPSLPYVDFLSYLLGLLLTSWVPSWPNVDIQGIQEGTQVVIVPRTAGKEGHVDFLTVA